MPSKSMVPKIVYCVLLVVVFFVPVFYAFDIFNEASKYRWHKVNIASEKTWISGATPAKIRSVGRAHLSNGAYDEFHQTIAATLNYPMKFYQSKLSNGVKAVVDKKVVTCKYIGYDLITGERMRYNYNMGGGFGFCLLIIWLALTILVILMCNGWTSCGK